MVQGCLTPRYLADVWIARGFRYVCEQKRTLQSKPTSVFSMHVDGLCRRSQTAAGSRISRSSQHWVIEKCQQLEQVAGSVQIKGSATRGSCMF
jgi:hypothetical protein